MKQGGNTKHMLSSLNKIKEGGFFYTIFYCHKLIANTDIESDLWSLSGKNQKNKWEKKLNLGTTQLVVRRWLLKNDTSIISLDDYK